MALVNVPEGQSFGVALSVGQCKPMGHGSALSTEDPVGQKYPSLHGPVG